MYLNYEDPKKMRVNLGFVYLQTMELGKPGRSLVSSEKVCSLIVCFFILLVNSILELLQFF